MNKDPKLANNPTMEDDYLFSASSQDCTGLIPTIAHDEYEADNYNELYPYQPMIPPEIGVPVTNPFPGRMPGAEVPIPTTLR